MDSAMEVIMERTRGWGAAYEGVVSLFGAANWTMKEEREKKSRISHRWLPFHLQTQQSIDSGVSNGRYDGDNAWPWRSVWGGLVSSFGAANWMTKNTNMTHDSSKYANRRATLPTTTTNMLLVTTATKSFSPRAMMMMTGPYLLQHWQASHFV